ncbi:uncharacterized protein LOC127425103 [Myxocyprinus asiaticus]|uniref:uncharacterized protein LOC127425103 n=1 Tax=Myxocyprinus asiaticus TaxID=70543 RepID=UPI00222171E1|nr:uncharacterized protein LOC127425103 [Myxocyprinus asiaticus]XP_051526717.1 uncharacterized protein LOC127425103 [Myxocyprinus asiaticus]
MAAADAQNGVRTFEFQQDMTYRQRDTMRRENPDILCRHPYTQGQPPLFTFFTEHTAAWRTAFNKHFGEDVTNIDNGMKLRIYEDDPQTRLTVSFYNTGTVEVLGSDEALRNFEQTFNILREITEAARDTPANVRTFEYQQDMNDRQRKMHRDKIRRENPDILCRHPYTQGQTPLFTFFTEHIVAWRRAINEHFEDDVTYIDDNGMKLRIYEDDPQRHLTVTIHHTGTVKVNCSRAAVRNFQQTFNILREITEAVRDAPANVRTFEYQQDMNDRQRKMHRDTILRENPDILYRHPYTQGQTSQFTFYTEHIVVWTAAFTEYFGDDVTDIDGNGMTLCIFEEDPQRHLTVTFDNTGIIDNTGTVEVQGKLKALENFEETFNILREMVEIN